MVKTSSHFERSFKKLPRDLKELTKKKLRLLLEDPSYPSLRVKKVQGYHETPSIMEMSVTMSLRVTFQIFPDFIYLRHVGTHEILRNP